MASVTIVYTMKEAQREMRVYKKNTFFSSDINTVTYTAKRNKRRNVQHPKDRCLK